MRKTFFTLVLLSLLPMRCTRSQEQSPAEVANEFYKEAITFTRLGLPPKKELDRVRSMMTPELQQLFARAQRDRDEEERKYPDEKSSWSDGYLFSSLFEGPTAFKVGEASAEGDRASVKVNFENAEGSESFKWSDTVLLFRQDGRWLVDDIRFEGKWGFKIGDSLKGVLQPLPQETGETH